MASAPTPLRYVNVPAIDPERFAGVLPPAEYQEFLGMVAAATRDLHGRVIWNVNSTARGGGVVELLRNLLGYARGGGVDARWAVIAGSAEFFDVTKRLHNHLHGFATSGGLGRGARAVYERTTAANAAELAPLLRPSDVVILHDPQTAGMVEALRGSGATVIWRCHVGLDHPNAVARRAWEFLRPYVAPADAYVFSRASFAWSGLDPQRICVIQPSIDAFSPKNQSLTPRKSLSILAQAAMVAHPKPRRNATFTRGDGTPGRVDREADLLEEARVAPEAPLVVQVSRWDRLKDHLGVMAGFSEHVAPHTDAHLMLAGPATDSVADDPEGAAVFAEVAAAWRELPREARRRVHLASLPMDDVEENAAIVNALQSHATVVVQKSLAEGFGLTVAEAMWKRRPVVASRIGGIQDQIVDGESGVLIDDPTNLEAFGAAVASLLGDPWHARRMGTAAQARVRECFLGPHHLHRYFDLIEALISGRSPAEAGPRAQAEPLAGVSPAARAAR